MANANWRPALAVLSALSLAGICAKASPSSSENQADAHVNTTTNTTTTNQTNNQTNTQVRTLLLNLGDGETAMEDAAIQLRKVPREQVLAVLREGLSAKPEPRAWALRGALAVKAVELLPEFELALGKADDYHVFVVAAQLLKLEPSSARRLACVQIELGRLSTLVPAARQAVLEGMQILRQPLPKTTFTALVDDPEPFVRVSLVRQFISSQSLLNAHERIERLEILKKIEPLQARHALYQGLSSMSAADRKASGFKLEKSHCQTEIAPDLKTACLKAVTSLKGEGPK